MAASLEPTRHVLAGRAKWQYRGQKRPPFAHHTPAGMESVWDYPRPPVIEPVPERLEVRHGQRVLAGTERGVRVLETAGAPTYYFPPEDTELNLFDRPQDQTASLCEWKGLAQALTIDRLAVGWRYVEVFPEFTDLLNWCSFHPGVVACYLGSELTSAQPGGYYGGWVTQRLTGPFKGAQGSERW